MEQPLLFDIPPIPTPSTVQLIESLLFIAGEPLTIIQLAHVLELAPDAVEAALEELAAACRRRGVRVQRSGEHVQLVSAPESAAVVERFLGSGRSRAPRRRRWRRWRSLPIASRSPARRSRPSEGSTAAGSSGRCLCVS